MLAAVLLAVETVTPQLFPEKHFGQGRATAKIS
jgi:hypothetical protein